jgi:hypothetical protein
MFGKFILFFILFNIKYLLSSVFYNSTHQYSFDNNILPFKFFDGHLRLDGYLYYEKAVLYYIPSKYHTNKCFIKYPILYFNYLGRYGKDAWGSLNDSESCYFLHPNVGYNITVKNIFNYNNDLFIDVRYKTLIGCINQDISHVYTVSMLISYRMGIISFKYPIDKMKIVPQWLSTSNTELFRQYYY